MHKPQAPVMSGEPVPDDDREKRGGRTRGASWPGFASARSRSRKSMTRPS